MNNISEYPVEILAALFSNKTAISVTNALLLEFIVSQTKAYPLISQNTNCTTLKTLLLQAILHKKITANSHFTLYIHGIFFHEYFD
jgi:hypothetical protein